MKRFVAVPSWHSPPPPGLSTLYTVLYVVAMKMFVFLFTRKCLQKFIFVLLKMVIKHSSKFCFCQKNKNKFCIFATTNNLPYSYTVIGAPCIKFYFLKLYANFLTKSFLSNSFHLNVIADALGKNILTINTEFCNRQILQDPDGP